MSAKSRRRGSPAPAILLLLVVFGLGAAAARVLPRYLGPRPRAASSPAPPAPAAAAPVRPPATEGVKSITARVYFLRIVDDEERMTPVARRVAAEAPARAALEALLSDQAPPGCQPPLPAGVALRSVRVEDGVATVDFSRELISGFRGGSDNEGVTVYAIVDTLCSLPGVHTVQILVEGQRVDSLGGHLDISGPLAPDAELVVANDG